MNDGTLATLCKRILKKFALGSNTEETAATVLEDVNLLLQFVDLSWKVDRDMSFRSGKEMKLPTSLNYLFKELQAEFSDGIGVPNDSKLAQWTRIVSRILRAIGEHKSSIGSFLNITANEYPSISTEGPLSENKPLPQGSSSSTLFHDYESAIPAEEDDERSALCSQSDLRELSLAVKHLELKIAPFLRNNAKEGLGSGYEEVLSLRDMTARIQTVCNLVGSDCSNQDLSLHESNAHSNTNCDQLNDHTNRCDKLLSKMDTIWDSGPENGLQRTVREAMALKLVNSELCSSVRQFISGVKQTAVTAIRMIYGRLVKLSDQQHRHIGHPLRVNVNSQKEVLLNYRKYVEAKSKGFEDYALQLAGDQRRVQKIASDSSRFLCTASLQREWALFFIGWESFVGEVRQYLDTLAIMKVDWKRCWEMELENVVREQKLLQSEEALKDVLEKLSTKFANQKEGLVVSADVVNASVDEGFLRTDGLNKFRDSVTKSEGKDLRQKELVASYTEAIERISRIRRLRMECFRGEESPFAKELKLEALLRSGKKE